ncbi:UNVERIFIED_CONTAM: 2-dehydropantoate 2-reductase [Microbacterium sp. SLM126]
MTGITFVGAGALGTAFAAMLAPVCPVTLMAREQTAQRLNDQGMLSVRRLTETIVVPVGEERGSVRVVSSGAHVPRGDAVVFVTKGRQLGDVVSEVRRTWDRGEGFVLGLQNGVVKDDVLAAAFGRDAVLGAATVLGARRDDAGTVMVTGLGQTYLGEFDGAETERLRLLTEWWDAAGLPVRTDLPIAELLWTKCVNALGAFGVGCLTQLPSTTAMQSRAIVGLFLSILREGAAVAAAEGHPVADFPDLPIAEYVTAAPEVVIDRITGLVREAARRPGAVPAYSSMAQDVLAGRATEVDSVFGDVVRRAQGLGVATPTLEVVLATVSGFDELVELSA